jgi:crotonobetaine/carnitine-CoA ligase
MSRTYQSPASRFPFEQWSLPALLAFHAENNSGRIFIRWTHEGPGHTFEASAKSIAGLAGALRAAGIRPGDRVALYMSNSLMHVWCWLALNVIGAVDAPLNPAYFSDMLAHQLNLVRPKAVIVDKSLQPRIEQVRAAVDPDSTIRFIVNAEAEPQRIDDLAGALGLAAADAGPVAACDPRAPATILFTSGTTGRS